MSQEHQYTLAEVQAMLSAGNIPTDDYVWAQAVLQLLNGILAASGGGGGGITQLTGDVIAGPGSGSIASTIANIKTGNTLWVDSVNGVDATGARGNQAKPFLTVSAAITAASSGDTVYIRPGTYAVTASILKNGVNIFAYGATISMTGVAFQDGQLSDGGSAKTCNVYGGTYTRTESVNSGDGIHARIVGVTNASSNIYIEAESLLFTSTMSSTGDYCVWQEAGTLKVICPFMKATATLATSVVVGWLNGACFIRSQQMLCGGVAVYSQVDSTPTGDLYIEADLIDTTLSAGADFTIWQNGTDTTAAVWIRASVIKSSSQTGSRAITTSSGKANKLYVTCQKIFGLAGLDGSGLTYITTDKWEALGNGGVGNALFVSTSAGTSFVNCRHYDPSTFTGAAIRSKSGSADVRIGAGYYTGNASSAIGLRVDGGTLRANGMRVDTSANSGTNPAANNGGVLVLTNCTLVADSGADSINASSPQNVVAMSSWANTAVNINVTVTTISGLTVSPNVV